MNNEPKQPGNFLQRVWWAFRRLYHQLKPTRFSFIVALLACPVFLCVAQGTEILRTVGEGMAGDQSYAPRVCAFFAALLLWAVCSWYAARVLLYVNFPGLPRAPAQSEFAETHAPRLLGVAPILIVAGGFLVAAQPYGASSARLWLYSFAGVCLVLAILFYVALIFRRRMIGETRRVEHIKELRGATVAAVAVLLVGSLGLFVTFAIDPVSVPQWLGMGTILFLAATSWISAGSLLVYFGGRWQLPLITALAAAAVLFSLWNDNHIIRTLPPQEVKRQDVIQSFREWYALAEKNDGAGVRHPLFIVATEGGGIRAAYWTATILGGLQDANPDFAPHLFAISGVSGGSLGAVVFDALLAEPNPPGSFEFKKKADEILGQDFLSPALGSMLYPDFIQRFLPFPVPHFDRGRALELGWERGWRDIMNNNRLAGSFVDLWNVRSREWMPALFLNGTSVEKGHRIITTNLRLTNVFLDAEDAADTLAGHGLPATKAACHIPLSTAADMSARFTYVSPAGRFPGGSHVVDGGYFENAGATTALEIVNRIKDVCRYDKISNVEVKVIMISNDPRKGSIMIAPAKPVEEAPGPKRSTSVRSEGNLLGDVMAPIHALLNTREARGVYAQKTIRREQRPFKAGEPPDPLSDTKDIVYFALHDINVPLPLGWLLSSEAAKTMQNQLYLDDTVVHNGEAMDQVLKSLPIRLAP
ncbi:MAG: hypothetical protein QOK24_223 [Verrucomicrobiota bacterium]|jgi:hypothetical protein